MDHRVRIGLNIKKFRVARKMSQEQLAKASHRHHNYIQRLEKGKHYPNIETLKAIAEALGCSAAALLEGI